LFQFSRRARKKTLVITDLSFSLQYLLKNMEKTIVEVTEKHLKDNAVISHSQRRFTKRKSCLMNLISFYDEFTHVVDQGETVDVIF